MEGRRRQGRGRQRIPMQLIESQDDLYATFSKRRLGIYKKATELCTLCDVDVGIILFSPTDIPYSFFHPRMDSVVSRSINPDQPPSDFDRIIDSHTRGRIEAKNRELDRILAAREVERERWQRAMAEIRSRNIWMRQPLETLTREQALVWRAWFREFKTRITRRIEQLQNQASSSAMPPLPPPEAGENVENMVISDGAEDADNIYRPSMPPGQFYAPGQTSNDPNFGGGGPSASTQYYFPPPESQNPFAGGGAPFPDPFFGPSQELNLGTPGGAPSYQPYYVYPPPPDFSATGGVDFPGQFYAPSPPLDFSAAGGADVPGQVYFPLPPHDPASGGPSNQDEADPYNQKDDDA